MKNLLATSLFVSLSLVAPVSLAAPTVPEAPIAPDYVYVDTEFKLHFNPVSGADHYIVTDGGQNIAMVPSRAVAGGVTVTVPYKGTKYYQVKACIMLQGCSELSQIKVVRVSPSVPFAPSGLVIDSNPNPAVGETVVFRWFTGDSLVSGGFHQLTDNGEIVCKFYRDVYYGNHSYCDAKIDTSGYHEFRLNACNPNGQCSEDVVLELWTRD